MNIGDCPYDDCPGVFFLAVPAKTPAFAKVECDECHRPAWYKFSRLDPMAWTEADFLATHRIDEKTMSITAIETAV